MDQVVFPEADQRHIYTEMTMVLCLPKTKDSEGGEYGRIECLLPMTFSGEPDETRSPVFRGLASITAVTPQGRAVSIPLTFSIPVLQINEAILHFKKFAERAVKEFQSENFRRAVQQPGVIQQ